MEMTRCRVVSCSSSVVWIGLENSEAMEAKLVLRRMKRHVQIRISSDCWSGRSLSVRLSVNSSDSKIVRGAFQTFVRAMISRSEEKSRVMMLEVARRHFVPTLQVAQSRYC